MAVDEIRMADFDKRVALHWFESLSESEKAHVIILFTHQLTIVMRSIYLDHEDDCETSSRLAYVISELDHRLLAGASELLTSNRSFSDETLVDLMMEAPRRELTAYFPFVLEQIVKTKSKL